MNSYRLFHNLDPRISIIVIKSIIISSTNISISIGAVLWCSSKQKSGMAVVKKTSKVVSLGKRQIVTEHCLALRVQLMQTHYSECVPSILQEWMTVGEEQK